MVLPHVQISVLPVLQVLPVGITCCTNIIRLVVLVQIPVAVKTIRGASVEAMFLKEADSMMRLHHPHIIRLHGIVLGTPLMLVS